MPPSDHNRAFLEILPLGSGSAGNAIIARSSSGAVLVDCGFSARETLRRAREVGVEGEDIAGILLTHEHSDHVRGVRVLAKRLGLPVYATGGTRRAAHLDNLVDDVREVTAGHPFELAGLTVIPVRTSHDAAEPVAYRLEAPGGSSAGIATDTGNFTGELLEAFSGLETLVIECNHDVEMLVGGPYPYFLKQRILSERGHLSNEAAAGAVATLACDRLRCVYAAHLSRTNNLPGLASAALETTLARLGLAVKVSALPQ